MQLARLLDPKPRTYKNKFVEMFKAFQLEWKYSKSEILNMYLTLVPYGGNIEGIKAAAYFYYKRLPQKLSLAQISTLAIVPNRPNTYLPTMHNKELLSARNKWLNKMKQAKLFNKDDIADAQHEPLDAVRTTPESVIPHLAIRLHQQLPDNPVIHTTIDVQKQHKVAALTYNYSQRMHAKSIHNASVIVINNKTHSVEAYVGSADMNDKMYDGQVDGVTAIRSPGSTLKPFVYAIAFEKGLYTPKSVVADVPVDFDGYAPENYNTKFNGNITIEHALANSLNIPAVKILSQTGILTFTDLLSRASFQQIRKDERKLGLSSVLGGCGVTLEELTFAYAAFANEGKYYSPRYLLSHIPAAGHSLISPASAFMINEILNTPVRPDLPTNYQSSIHVPKISWKTGTSYGRRDAWSIGYNSNYTIGVWLGNFSGKGTPELSGADIATPLLFEIFNSIDYNSRDKWFVQPEELDFRLVCSESGKVPEEFCDHQVVDYFIPGVSSGQRCNHLKKIFIAPDESFSYCITCVPEKGFKTKYYPDYSQDLLNYYLTEQLPYLQIPPHNNHCSRIFTASAPVITSPVHNKEYYIEKDENQQLLLSCNPDNEVKSVYWYINDRFYKSSLAGEDVFFKPQPGQLKISCSDDKGRNTDAVIHVNYF
jgi:penicillin-binding protein 1C